MCLFTIHSSGAHRHIHLQPYPLYSRPPPQGRVHPGRCLSLSQLSQVNSDTQRDTEGRFFFLTFTFFSVMWGSAIRKLHAVYFSGLDPTPTEEAQVAMTLILRAEEGGHLAFSPVSGPPDVPGRNTMSFPNSHRHKRNRIMTDKENRRTGSAALCFLEAAANDRQGTTGLTGYGEPCQQLMTAYLESNSLQRFFSSILSST